MPQTKTDEALKLMSQTTTRIIMRQRSLIVMELKALNKAVIYDFCLSFLMSLNLMTKHETTPYLYISFYLTKLSILSCPYKSVVNAMISLVQQA